MERGDAVAKRARISEEATASARSSSSSSGLAAAPSAGLPSPVKPSPESVHKTWNDLVRKLRKGGSPLRGENHLMEDLGDEEPTPDQSEEQEMDLSELSQVIFAHRLYREDFRWEINEVSDMTEPLNEEVRQMACSILMRIHGKRSTRKMWRSPSRTSLKSSAT
jgi:hypothetical protein